MKNNMMAKLIFTLIVVSLTSCSSIIKLEKTQIEKVPVFEIFQDDMDSSDIRSKGMCVQPRYVNIKFDTTYIYRYPNPCAPREIPPYMIYLNENDNLNISIISEDINKIAVHKKILKNGYYIFRTEHYLLRSFGKEKRYNRQWLKSTTISITLNNFSTNKKSFQYSIIWKPSYITH